MLFFHRLGPYSTHGSRINRTFMEATWSYDLRVRCLCPCTKIARKMDRKLIRYQTDGFPDPLSAIYFTNVCSLFEEKIVRHIAGWMSSISKVKFCSVQEFSILLAKIVHTSLSSCLFSLIEIALILYYIGIFLLCFSFFVLFRFENKIYNTWKRVSLKK